VGRGHARVRLDQSMGRKREKRGVWATAAGPTTKRERERFCFSSFFSFTQKPFQTHFKIILNHFHFLVKTTHHNKSNAKACMLKHVANSYGEF